MVTFIWEKLIVGVVVARAVKLVNHFVVRTPSIVVGAVSTGVDVERRRRIRSKYVILKLWLYGL
jgi:hypothetical protein